MNRIIKLCTILLAWVSVWMGACTPDDFDLGNIDVHPDDLVEGIAFKIEHDQENPNIVYLTSLMDSRYTPLWDHPQGRSQAHKVTLKIPFEGTYQIKFGVQTRGGIVFGEPASFTIDNFYAGFVDHEMWTFLTGGVGKQKTWIHDNGQYGMAPGEMSYADPSSTVDWDNFTPNWEPAGGHTDENGFIWDSEMTFSLIGGAEVKVSNVFAEGTKEEQGTFMIDIDNHTLTMVNAELMHTQGWQDKTTNWSKGLKILTLNENQLRVAVLREKEISGEDEWWLIWNFVSKEYAESYEALDPEPPYNGNANEDLTTSIATSRTWKVNLEAPYNWAGLDGTFLNVWQQGDGRPVFEGWEPPYDQTLLSNISLTMTLTGENSGQFVWIIGTGETIAGTYTIDDKNWIDFGRDIHIIDAMGGWLNLGTDGGKMRMIRVEKDVSDNISVLHLGRINPGNAQEYMTLALVPGGSGSGSATSGKEISVDNAKVKFGDLEDNGNLRLELFNAYGSTANAPALDVEQLKFEKKISITFTLGGITLQTGAVGNYVGDISLADADWSMEYWGGGPGKTDVQGNGTYTVWFNPETRSEGAQVFVVDVVGLANDIADLSSVTARIDKIVIE